MRVSQSSIGDSKSTNVGELLGRGFPQNDGCKEESRVDMSGGILHPL